MTPPMPPPRPGPATGGPASGRQDWLRQQAAQRRERVICGAHGGAGTTTLACWLSPPWDMGAMRPARDPGPPAIIAHGRPLLVACRNTTAAAAAATAAVAALTRPGTRVAVLVVVSDGWPQPPAATARFRLLAPQVGAVVHIPFVPALRVADGPAGVPLPRPARRAVDQIRAATGRPLTT